MQDLKKIYCWDKKLHQVSVVTLNGTLGNEKSGYYRKVAVVERWPLVDVLLYWDR